MAIPGKTLFNLTFNFKFALELSEARGAFISDFCNMKQLEVFLLSTELDRSPLHGYLPALNSPVPIYIPGCSDVSAFA